MSGYSRKHRAVAQVAGYPASTFELEPWDHYGLESYTDGGSTYAVGTDEEADSATTDYIADTLWAFNASFLAEQTDLPEEIFSALQESKSEDANDTFRQLVDRSYGGLEGLVDEAISADGRGHMLAGYDGTENEVIVDGITFYVYQTN